MLRSAPRGQPCHSSSRITRKMATIRVLQPPRPALADEQARMPCFSGRTHDEVFPDPGRGRRSRLPARAQGIAAVLSDRKRSKKRGIEMKPADLQIVKAAKPRSLAVAIGTGLLFVLILFLAFGSWFQVDQGERRGGAQRQAGARGRARPGFQDAFHRQRVGGVGARPHLRVREPGSLQLRPAARDAACVGHVPRAGRARGGTLFRVRHHQQSAGTRAGAQDARRRQERVRPLHRRALSRNARSWAWT